MRRLLLFILFAAAAAPAAAQQSDTDRKIAEQERIIADLERRIQQSDKEIDKLRKERSSAQSQAAGLTRRISSRNRQIEATERKASLIETDMRRADSASQALGAELSRLREAYSEMVREAYRNYRHNNFLTYIFTSGDFEQMTHRLSMLRSVADLRSRRLHEIARVREQVAAERAELDRRSRQLDSARRTLASQQARLKADEKAAKAAAQRLSRKEKEAMKRQQDDEQRLSVAMDELRRLSKGNKEGGSFSSKTTNLRLPVEGGRVKRYNGNMAEVVGPKGARVISIYDGKVLKITQNRITGKYDVYVAHGEYVSSYANLGSVCVSEGQKIARNGQLGVIGSAVDLETMSTHYRMMFGIYHPSPKVQLKASNCFRK